MKEREKNKTLTIKLNYIIKIIFIFNKNLKKNVSIKYILSYFFFILKNIFVSFSLNQ